MVHWKLTVSTNINIQPLIAVIEFNVYLALPILKSLVYRCLAGVL